MKKLVVILGSVFVLSTASCVKHKNCEEGISGTFQYLKEPLDSYANKKIKAYFFEDGDTLNRIAIVGNIPEGYKSDELMKVRVCLKVSENSPMMVYVPLYKLTCIEKED